MDFFDLHCDTAYECYIKNQEFYVNQLAVSGKQGDAFHKWKQFFAIWVRDDCPEPFLFYKRVFCDFKEKLKNAPKSLTPYFSVEGGAVIEEDSDRVFVLKQDGIKLLTLTWNGENAIAGGAHSEKGLTPFGKEVIDKMNRLKIGCDLSHLNQKSFYAALDIAEFPLATHSNCCAVTPHRRNLDDNQIKLLVQKGGIIGLVFYPEFLGKNVMGKIYENIYHLLELGLEDSIAIGSDFDGGKMAPCLDCLSKIPFLFSFLEQKGLKKDLLYKIFFKNADNFIAKL